MITYANLGENLMRRYSKKGKRSRLMDLYWNPSKARRQGRDLLRSKAIDRGTFGSTDKAWYDRKKKEYRVPRNTTGGK